MKKNNDAYRYQNPSVCRVPDGYRRIIGTSFRGGRYIRTLHLPSTLETVSPRAFRPLTSLTRLNIPPSVTTVGDYAAFSMLNLKSVSGFGGLTEAGSGIFAGCESLHTAIFADGMRVIGDRMFWNCNLREVVIPKTVRSIGEAAFELNRHLRKVTILSNEVSFGKDVFHGCDALRQIACTAAVKEVLKEKYPDVRYRVLNL